MPAATRGGRGSGFSIGSGRHPASRSAVLRWTRTPSAGSKSTTPTSSSTGRRFCRRSRLRLRLPRIREPATAAKTERTPVELGSSRTPRAEGLLLPNRRPPSRCRSRRMYRRTPRQSRLSGKSKLSRKGKLSRKSKLSRKRWSSSRIPTRKRTSSLPRCPSSTRSITSNWFV